MPMALQALPPLLMLPMETAPPLAEAVATPPFPAEAVSINWAPTLPTPAKPATVPATTALMRLFIMIPLASRRAPIASQTRAPIALGSDNEPTPRVVHCQSRISASGTTDEAVVFLLNTPKGIAPAIDWRRC